MNSTITLRRRFLIPRQKINKGLSLCKYKFGRVDNFVL